MYMIINKGKNHILHNVSRCSDASSYQITLPEYTNLQFYFLNNFVMITVQITNKKLVPQVVTRNNTLSSH